MTKDDVLKSIEAKYQSFRLYLNEQTQRIWAAIEARSLGRGGVNSVARVTGLSRTTIYAALKELQERPHRGEGERQRTRKPGGGRKKLKDTDPKLLQDLEVLLEPVTRGDPESPLRWTCKSTAKLAGELQARGCRVSQRAVYTLLRELGYSLQANRKTKEGPRHPDRNAQLLYISDTVKDFQECGQPVISVDTKKKELIGEFKNNGQEWHSKGEPIEVNVHDFADAQLGEVAPYGVYDLAAHHGWVNVGISHDTAQFAVESIRRWWYEMGKPLYPQAAELLITSDCGGSNGYRVRLWKFELQKLATELGLTIHVCHSPPGTSKWNKIEHRMFCPITQNWRGRPLTTREVVVNLISNTKTGKGLEIKAVLDENKYHTGIKITEVEFKSIAIERCDFHGEWNYKIKPRQPQ